MKRIFCFVISGLFVLGFHTVSLATTWTETGETGSLPSNATDLTGINDLDMITGTLVDPNVDMFKLYLTGDSFVAQVTTTTGSNISWTQFFLFDSNGLGLMGHGGVENPSILYYPPAGGYYYLAFSPYNIDPFSTDGRIFPTQTGSIDPTGVGSNLPITQWGGANYMNTHLYSISLTGVGAAPSPVPEPATILLLGLGLLGLAGVSRKKY